MRKIIVWMTMAVLIFSVSSISGVDALNHHGGGESGEDITHSGINTTGYHWVVYEIDDWGMFPSAPNVTVRQELIDKGLKGSGFFSQGSLENISDMNDFFGVLADHPEVVMTAFFVMNACMNGTAMLANGFTEYVGIPINKTGFMEETVYNSSGPNYRGNIVAKWVEGYTEGYWLPQYHGTSHGDMTWLLQNCSEGCETIIDAVVNYSMAPSRMPGESCTQLSNSEYANNALLTVVLGEGNKTTVEAQENLTRGLAQFYNLFGFHPESTVAPNHELSENTLNAFLNTTIYGHSSCPGYGRNAIGTVVDWGWQQFDYDVSPRCAVGGISHVGRKLTINGLNLTDLSDLMDDINTTFSNGQVAVIEDHKIAYTSAIRDVLVPGERNSSLALLDALFTGIKTWYPDVWYLTSPEIHQLNIRGYSIQNWTDKIVARNALNNTTTMTINLPPGWDANIVTVTNDTGVSKDFTKDDSRTITLDVPHNETFTVYRNYGTSPPSYPEYDFSGIQALVMAAAVIVIIVVLVFKGMIGPISGSFGRMK